jgi:hypothetical protein
MAKVVVPHGLRSINWVEKLGSLWCRYLHAAVMWPIHGHYNCRVCYRQYPVLWESTYAPTTIAIATAAKAGPHTVSKALGSDGSRTLAQRPLVIGLN